MTSILRKLRSGRRKSRTKPTQQDYYYDSRLSIKSTDSSHASDIDYSRPRKPLQLMDDEDDQTHPMQEQSPSQFSFAATPRSTDQHQQHNGSGSGSKRHIHFPFVRRKSDPRVVVTDLPMNTNSHNPNPETPPLRRRLRMTPKQEQKEQDQEDMSSSRRKRFGRGFKKTAATTTTASSNDAQSTRLDASGKLHHQISSDELAMNREAERIARAAAALDNRGNELFERGYFDKAMEAYSKALKLKRRTFHSMLEEADQVLEEDDDDNDDEDDNADYSKSDPKLLVSMATSINNIGYLRQRSGDATPDETMAAYKKSLRIKRKILGNDSLSVGKTLNNVGSVHYLKRDFDGAIPAYEEALQIMQANLGEDHPDVATVMSNMGDVHLAKGNSDQGLHHYRMALNIRWAAFGERDPRVIRLLEKIARIEMGDRMTPTGADTAEKASDWDESELFDLDTRPLSDELHTLHEEVEEDMQFVDLLQKRMAVDMVKDKVNILRGMRELSDDEEAGEDSRRGSSHHDDESDNPIPAGTTGTDKRSKAQQHVHDRLARIRSRRASGSEYGHYSDSQLNNSDSQLQGGHDSNSSWKKSKNNIYGTAFYSPQANRRKLSTIQSTETNGEVNNNNIRSAMKLKNGINSLRSLDCDDASLNSTFSLNSKLSKKSQISKKSQQ